MVRALTGCRLLLCVTVQLDQYLGPDLPGSELYVGSLVYDQEETEKGSEVKKYKDRLVINKTKERMEGDIKRRETVSKVSLTLGLR